MRGNKPYSPDDDNFEVIFKALRNEEAYADLRFGDEDNASMAADDAPSDVADEAVEASEDDWKDVTEDFLIQDVKVPEDHAEQVSEDVQAVDDGTDGDFADVDRAEIDLELNETATVDEVEPAEADGVEPAWEEEPAADEVEPADVGEVEPAWEEKSTADQEAELEAADNAALIAIVSERVGGKTYPLEGLIHQLGLEDQVGLEDDLNADVDDLGEDEMVGMELDLSFEDEDEEK